MATDDEDFKSLFSDAKPVKSANKVERPSSPSSSRKPDKAAAYRRQLASGALDDVNNQKEQEDAQVRGSNFVSDEYVDWIKPDDILAFKRGGVQDGVYKKFRLGKYAIDGRLDLHRHTVDQAREAVNAFLIEATANDARCVLILHGKGDRNPERQAVLKSYLAKWLQESIIVLAFHSAQQHHGGRGAAYVLLKKSEAMKEKTREKLGRKL